ncbi:aminoglycoside phosphotransferase [Streptomyces sp. V4-01]|uniref:Aminoglycoside phosphotransferase n=1 Tax=Actinacidiphila polyblastidii TaxID=3110430 RepID=A0ABU7PF94_9ACTN|nr:aminoglycoside phosphotransferase [Streptomyces sp. V4-01]
MIDEPSTPVPPAAVLDAFGVRGVPVPLTGGQGRSVRVGAFVLKPAEGPEDESEWGTALMERLASGRDGASGPGPASSGGFRVPRPLRAADGRGVVDGWTAAEFLDGQPGPHGHWDGVLRAGRAFHAALRDLPRPGFLARRTHPWAVADRAAWGEQDVGVVEELSGAYAALCALRRPVRQDGAQLVHGDLTGNVLFAAGAEPAVIDFSPYWRPPAFAEAVVVADGLLWFGLRPGEPAGAGAVPDWQQMLVRALIFRLVAHSESAGPTRHAQPGEPERYARAIDAVRAIAPAAGAA